MCHMLFVFVAYSGVQHVVTIRVTWRVSYKRKELFTLFFFFFFVVVRVAHLFSLLRCPIMCLYVLNSVSITISA